MAEFNYHKFHRSRQLLKTTGWILLVLGFIFILDLFFREPMPLSGRKAIYAGLACLALGSTSLYAGYRLPLDEAIEIIHQRGQGITASELIHLMRVDRVTADRIIAALVEKGFLKSSSKRNDVEEVFDAVR